MNSKWFGTLSSIIGGVVITAITFLFGINLIAINSLGKIPIYFWSVLLVAFLLLTFLGKNIKRKTFNWMYLGLIIFSFIYLNSMLQWSVECCPDAYESMQDWNASKGLAWIVHIPTAFIIVTIQGITFDFLREQNFKRNKTSDTKPALKN